MYSERKFRIRSLEDIIKDLEIGKDQHGVGPAFPTKPLLIHKMVLIILLSI